MCVCVCVCEAEVLFRCILGCITVLHDIVFKKIT